MKNFNINIQYPIRLLIIIPAIVLILIPLLRIPRKRRTFKKTAPAAIRSVISVLLVLAISGLQYSFMSSEEAVVILLDQSFSTQGISDQLLDTAQSVVDELDKDTLVAVVRFAQNQTCTLEFGSEPRVVSDSEFLYTSATNIGGAMEYAASLFPSERSKRIILISDGCETDGNAEAAAQTLSNQGIRVDGIYLDSSTIQNDIQMESVTCPSGAKVGEEIPITAVIYSSCDAPAVIRLNRSAYELRAKSVMLHTGENTVEFTMPIEEAGKHTFNVTVSASEVYNGSFRNDVGYCCVNASSSTSILVITNKVSDADLFKQSLSDEYTVIAKPIAEAPKTMVELCNYDGVVLMNLDLQSLPDGYDSLLKDYVEYQGRSLLLCGGGSTFMYGNMVGSDLETIVPVDFTVTEQSKGDSLALMILLDTSLSMAGNYITMAKEGAIKCIEALSDKDYVGLVTFNQFASMNASLSPATAVFKDKVAESITNTGTMNQTIYTRPLQMAYAELMDCDAPVKMAILLSDGGPADNTYSAVAKRMAADGITVSTIGMGFPSTVLAALAQDGCGHFSYATTAEDLPEIMLGEAEQLSMSAVQLGDFSLRITEDSDITNGYDSADLPIIRGYMPTVLKQGSTALITTTAGDPIYAINSYGKGKAAVFTSDLTDRWCSDWFSSSAARDIVSRMISTTLSPENHGSSMTADIGYRGKTVSVVLHTAGSSIPVTAEIQVANIYGSTTIPMNPAQRNTFKCSFITNKEGAYDVTFALKDAEGNVIDHLNTFFSVDYSDEYRSFRTDGPSTLETIADMTGGELTDDTSLAAAFEAPDATVYRQPLGLMASATLILLLADIAIRKLRWTDIKNIFKKDA